VKVPELKLGYRIQILKKKTLRNPKN